MSSMPSSSTNLSVPVHQVLEAIDGVILGKKREIKLAMCCLLAEGHLLIEDLPGMGKTTLSHAFAHVLGLDYQRVQFTSDLLPADILGVSIFDRESSTFKFHQGPIFTQLLLADEINRSTPKCQSALLEAMEERQVSIEGQTRLLPNPFFVIATQNPVSQAGTFPLPESQLDRFLMRICLGYPDERSERLLLEGTDRRTIVDDLPRVIEIELLKSWQVQVKNIKAASTVLDYIQKIIAFTRQESGYAYGLSPRAALALLKAAKSWAFIEGRDFVVHDDIQSVLSSVVDHRLSDVAAGRIPSQEILEKVPVL